MTLRGRRLAFDYGDVRIGVAVCDPDGILSTPLAPLASKNPSLFTEISALIAEYEPIAIYVGLPKNMSGTDGESAQKAQTFGAQLSSHSSLPIIYVDERLTTVSAQRALKDAGVNAKDSKSLIDSMSAVAILEQGLAHER
jgi:putative Holliday junction resolvase